MEKTVTLEVDRLNGKIHNIKELESGFMNNEGQIERLGSFKGINGKIDYSKMIHFYFQGEYNADDKFTPVISQEEYDNIKQSIKMTFGKRPLVDKMNEWLKDKSNTELTFNIKKELEDSVIDLI